MGRLCQTPAFHRNALQISSTRSSPLPPTSARCYGMELGTRFWWRARNARDKCYVGGAPGKVNLYVGKTAVKFNIPEAEAVDRLKDLIREHGKWVDASQATQLEAVS